VEDVRVLSDTNAALTAQAGSKDYELSTLQQRIVSMDALLQSRATPGGGEGTATTPGKTL